MTLTPTITRIAKAMLASGKLDFRTAVLRLGLTADAINTGVDSTNKLADITLLAASGNYPAGGYSLRNVALGVDTGTSTVRVIADNVVFEGLTQSPVSGLVIYAAGTFTDIYNYGEVVNPVIGVVDVVGTYGSSVIVDGGYGISWADGTLFFIG